MKCEDNFRNDDFFYQYPSLDWYFLLSLPNPIYSSTRIRFQNLIIAALDNMTVIAQVIRIDNHMDVRGIWDISPNLFLSKFKIARLWI